MTEIYWLQRIGNVSDVFTVALIVLIILLAIGVVGLLCEGEYWDDEFAELVKKWLKRGSVVFAFVIAGVVFIPSEKELLAIYGLGGTIDYIKSNDKAKQLPDKVVDALTRYVDSIEKNKKKEQQ